MHDPAFKHTHKNKANVNRLEGKNRLQCNNYNGLHTPVAEKDNAF